MKFNLKKISISLEQIYYFLKKIYIPLLIIILIALLCFSIFIYYQYIYKVVNNNLKSDIVIEKVNQEMLANVLNEMSARREILEQVWNSQYSNPFN